jgi:hypothetical protein
MATHYGQAAILTPSDYFFARDGIAAEGTVNQEQMVITDLDLDLLEEQRVNGTVLPLNDLIRDAYDRVIHYADHRRDAKLVSQVLFGNLPTRCVCARWAHDLW